MKYNARKVKLISKIVDEITSFYLENGAEDFQIRIGKERNNSYNIHIHGSISLSDSEIIELKKVMNIHHDVEYSEYWELMGEGESSDELALVARICDSVDISYKDRVLEMVLRKKV